MDFGKVLDHIGHFGWFQFYVYCLACIPQLFVGVHMLASVFILGEPKHRSTMEPVKHQVTCVWLFKLRILVLKSTSRQKLRCFVSGCDSRRDSDYEASWLNFTIPKEKDVDTGHLEYSQCLAFSHNDSLQLCTEDNFSNVSNSCSNFVYSKQFYNTTIVSEWDLVCAEKWKIPLANSLFMVGILTGAFCFGVIADKYGRKTIFTIPSLLFLACAVGTAFSPSFPVFVLLRFLTAAFASGLFQTAFIVAIEFVGPKYRLWCANLMQIIFAIGELLLAAAAYFIRDWKDLQLAISVPIVLLLSFYWLMPESVRWQLSCGRSEAALETMQRAAKWNGKELPRFLLEDVESSESFDATDNKKKNGILSLFKHPLLRRWFPNIVFNWFVNALVYYGLSLQAGKLGGNPYVNFVALSAVEIPSVFLSTFALSRFGRRLTLCITLLLGGIACVIPVALPKDYHWLSIPLAIIGKSNIAASFAVIYIYSAEIFPTVVRNTAIGIANTGARLGGIVAPNIAELSYLGEAVPMIIFGIFSVVAGLMSFDLPETNNKILPEEIDDVILLKSKRTSKGLFQRLRIRRKHSISQDVRRASFTRCSRNTGEDASLLSDD